MLVIGANSEKMERTEGGILGKHIENTCKYSRNLVIYLEAYRLALTLNMLLYT